jgi:hypothetical protein
MAGEGFGAVSNQDLLQAQQQEQLKKQQQAQMYSAPLTQFADANTPKQYSQDQVIQSGQNEGTAERGNQDYVMGTLGTMGSIAKGMVGGSILGPQGAVAGGLIGGAGRLFS